MAFALETYAKLRPMLFHGTAGLNLQSIRAEHKLHTAIALKPEYCAEQRSCSVRLTRGEHIVVLRDQRALQWGHIDLTGGWRREDLLRALNSRVFFWPGSQNGPISYGRRLFEAYKSSDQAVLRVDLWGLLKSNPDILPYFCKFNSGGPRSIPGRRSPRGPDTFILAHEWSHPASRVAEVSFVGPVSLPNTTELWEEKHGWKRL
jgi:hypothetical protein